MSSCRAALAAHPRTLPPCAADTELEREQHVNIEQVKMRVDVGRPAQLPRDVDFG